MITILIYVIRTLFTLYTLALIGRVLLPVLGVSYAHPVMRFLYDITEPLLAPIRRRIPATGGMDASPLALVLILWLLKVVLIQILWALR